MRELWGGGGEKLGTLAYSDKHDGQGSRGLCRSIPVNTKHLYNICTMSAQRRRRWAHVVQMVYKWFVFAGMYTDPCSPTLSA